MRRIALIVLASLAVVLQVSLLPAWRPFGVVPNLALVVMVLVALRAPTSEAVVAAAITGLILDLASGGNFGLWTGVFVLIALVAGMLHRAGIELDGPIVPLILVAAGTLVISVVILISLAPILQRWSPGSIGGRLLIELVINLGLTMALAPLVAWMLGGSSRKSIESGG